MKHVIKVGIVVMFFSSTFAVAQSTLEPVKDKADKKAEQVDKADKDKRVYKLEKKHLATKMTAEQKMATMDADKDGKISVDEASNADNKGYSENFAKIDTNGDGFIDLTEMKAKMAKKNKNKEKTKVKPEYNH